MLSEILSEDFRAILYILSAWGYIPDKRKLQTQAAKEEVGWGWFYEGGEIVVQEKSYLNGNRQ